MRCTVVVVNRVDYGIANLQQPELNEGLAVL